MLELQDRLLDRAWRAVEAATGGSEGIMNPERVLAASKAFQAAVDRHLATMDQLAAAGDSAVLERLADAQRTLNRWAGVSAGRRCGKG